MHSIKIRRLMSYIIDFFIVFLLVSLITQIKFLNPHSDKYEAKLQELSELQANLTEEQLEDPQFTKDLVDTYSGYMYDLGKYSVNQIIIVIVVITLYYTLFPLYNDNQTIGKRIMRLEIVSLKNNKKLKWYNLFIRSLVYPYYIDGVAIMYIFNVLSLLFFSEKSYVYVSVAIVLINLVYCYINFVMLLMSKQGISLHDRISGTKIVEKY